MVVYLWAIVSRLNVGRSLFCACAVLAVAIFFAGCGQAVEATARSVPLTSPRRGEGARRLAMCGQVGTDIEQLFLEARLEFKIRSDKAASLLQEFARKHGDSEWGDDARFLLGMLYKLEGRFDEALDRFRRACEIGDGIVYPKWKAEIEAARKLVGVPSKFRTEEWADFFVEAQRSRMFGGASDRDAHLRRAEDYYRANPNYTGDACLYEQANIHLQKGEKEKCQELLERLVSKYGGDNRSARDWAFMVSEDLTIDIERLEQIALCDLVSLASQTSDAAAIEFGTKYLDLYRWNPDLYVIQTVGAALLREKEYARAASYYVWAIRIMERGREGATSPRQKKYWDERIQKAKAVLSDLVDRK